MLSVREYGFRTRCLAIIGMFPAPSGCKSSEDLVLHQSSGRRRVSSNSVSLANHQSHRSLIQRKGVHCRSPRGIAPACLHSRCEQPPQKGCRGSWHRSPHFERNIPRRCQFCNWLWRRPNAKQQCRPWTTKSKPQRISSGEPRSGCFNTGGPAESRIDEKSRSREVGGGGRTSPTPQGAGSRGPSNPPFRHRFGTIGGTVAVGARWFGGSIEEPKIQMVHPLQRSDEAAQLVLERSAKRRAVEEDIPTNQQDLACWMVSKQLELRDALEMGDIGIIKELSQLLSKGALRMECCPSMGSNMVC